MSKVHSYNSFAKSECIVISPKGINVQMGWIMHPYMLIFEAWQFVNGKLSD
jgi:hypothetical protein